MPLAPATNAVTSKCSCCGLSALTPSSALAVPEPTLDFFGQALLPSFSRVACEHFGKPLPETTMVRGDLMSSALALRLVLLLVIVSWSFSLLGFLLVPALAGDVLTLSVASGAWAT